jgi:hypothetical protein
MRPIAVRVDHANPHRRHLRAVALARDPLHGYERHPPVRLCGARRRWDAEQRLTTHGPDGKPVGNGSSNLVYLAVPVKDASGANTQLIIWRVYGQSDRRAGTVWQYIVQSADQPPAVIH